MGIAQGKLRRSLIATPIASVTPMAEESARRRQRAVGRRFWVAVASALMLAGPASSEEEEDLAKKLANPVASLISVPIQANYDEKMGARDDGSVWRTNIQPVIPISLNENWNLISRTIVPLIDQDDLPTKGLGESGIGDTVQSLFLSPVEPTDAGWIWGVGPVFLIPTASDDRLGAEQYGLGPTAVVLKQQGPWTVGGLMNHIETLTGASDRDDVRATFVQPFLSYITKTKTTIGLNTESTYDWENDAWSLPINLTVMQLLRVGPQLLQVGGGVRYHAHSPRGGPEGWGARAQLTFLFPK